MAENRQEWSQHHARRGKSRQSAPGGRAKKKKGEGIWGVKKESWKFRTARWRCGEDGTEKIIETRVCQESDLLHPNGEILRWRSICPKGRWSLWCRLLRPETETNLSEWKMWWPRDEHIGHIELAMLMHRQQQCAKEWPSLLGENGKGSDSRRRNPWDISAQKTFCFVSKCRNLFFCSQFCELIGTPSILERAVTLSWMRISVYYILGLFFLQFWPLFLRVMRRPYPSKCWDLNWGYV